MREADQFNVAILVLGDIGRSPRMQYHALSLSQLSQVEHVDLIGYEGSELIAELRDSKKVSEYRMQSVFPSLKNGQSVPFVQRFFLLRALYKICVQFFTLLRLLLFRIDKPKYILVQVCLHCCICFDTS